ncbi:hypothetical protein F442_11881 [Phytophthora nicotianae P10297]|uniref:Uncharacterized protein n=1 Tax=Phytophthora nicotianae P10297 TaxID=1317064 RepID=W2Z0D8_PHYNI|nr:hypothetical protein F442_11881 [Phytophthora nicotianae P10297]
MSYEHRKKRDPYNKYDGDKSNRLALFPETHSWYEVKLIVCALDVEYDRLILMRLIEGAIVSTDLLEMRTSVHVENPNVFRTCMEWKYKEIQKSWQDYYSMTSAVD